MSSPLIWVDTDNALGSKIGDIDDAVAIIAMLKSSIPILAFSNIFGNTFQKVSFNQTQHLLQLMNCNLPQYSGANTWWDKSSEASDVLASIKTPIRILALGPLTNISLALKKNPDLKNYISEIIFVGTNIDRQFPTWRFFDFNIFKDKSAAVHVLNSDIPITLIPCDQARKLRMSFDEIKNTTGPAGNFLIEKSKRWFFRSRFLKFQRSVPIWDLLAVLYVLYPDQFKLVPVKMKKNLFNYVHVAQTQESHLRSVFSFSTDLKQQALDLLSQPV